MPAEGVDVAEQERDRESPGDGAERQEVAAEAQGQDADRQGRQAGEGEREEEPDPRRGAVRRRQPGGRIGSDADERGLAERGGAADAGEQHQSERDQRADADVVEQRDAELAEQERRDRDRGDEHRDRGTMPGLRGHSSISSSSSSWTEKKDLASSTGISRLKTITSLSAPLQNEAKLSTTPTAIAPRAVSG